MLAAVQGDLNSSAQTLRHHSDKVQALAWHPVDASVLLSAGFDRKVFALDVRSPADVRAWGLTADVECVLWNPHDAHYFAASSEDGVVRYFDARVNKKVMVRATKWLEHWWYAHGGTRAF